MPDASSPDENVKFLFRKLLRKNNAENRDGYLDGSYISIAASMSVFPDKLVICARWFY